MKILYVKNNSERNVAYQLRTLIFEKEHVRYVSKTAATPQARAHIRNIEKNYRLLRDSIVAKEIVPVPIVEADAESLTFAYIEGKDYETALLQASRDTESYRKTFSRYEELLERFLPVTRFDHTAMVTPELIALFGDLDYARFDGMPCYDGISNIDMIPSNIVVHEEKTYLLDYEWVFPLHLPVEFVLYRSYMLLSPKERDMLDRSFAHADLYEKMERHFIHNVVMKEGYYFYKNRYIKLNLPIEKHTGELIRLGNQLDTTHKEVMRLHNLGAELDYARALIAYRDEQIQQMRIKNRLKRLLNKFNPFARHEAVATPPEPPVRKTPVYRYTPPPLNETIVEEMERFAHKPLISIIMPVYNVDPAWLEKAVRSVERQWYGNWELCIADDHSTNEATLHYLHTLDHPQIKVRFLDKNCNISCASNAALEMATGEYVALLDNDDELTHDALYEMVKAINATQADFLYSDEDFVTTEGKYTNPHFKPDYSPDLLLSHNYITHLSCFRKTLIERAGGFRSAFDGAQDYDLFLRLTELTEHIHHIPKVLYHWRMIEGSTSADSEAKPEANERGKRALEEALQRRGIDGSVEYGNINHYFRVRYAIRNTPLVSIVIPFKDKPELLRLCIGSILERSTYENFEIVGISNNSTEEETFTLMRELERNDARVRFFEHNVPFNYAHLNNHAVAHHVRGEHLLLLNNDIEVITPEWIEAMLEHSQRPEIGCVGAKLYYPDDTIQHAGIIIGLGGYAGHSHKHLPRTYTGYFNRLNAIQNVSAVTAACMMVEKKIYDEVGGMDEEVFKVAYNDVDFCLRVGAKGYRNLFTPYAELYHHESISRGYETTPEKIARFAKEKEALFSRHTHILTHGDPYYNPNLTYDREDFSLASAVMSLEETPPDT